MPIPVLFALGYSLVLGTYEVAKTCRRERKKPLDDAIRYSKLKDRKKD